MSNKNALAFAVGLGGGYMKADRQAKEDALAEEERQAKAEDRARAREEHGWRRSAQEREVRKQLDLADAAAPRSAIEGSIVTDGQGNQNLYRDPAQAEAAREDLQAEAELRGGPSLADVKPGFGVTGTSLGNKITTQRPDVDAMNTPQDRNRRVIEATQKYDPKEAITLDAATTAAEKARFDLAAAKEDRRTKIEKENWVATVKASQSGDPAAVKAAFNKGGQYMIDGDLKVTPVKSKTPWGDVESFDYEGTIVDKDGNRTPVKINSFAAMADQVDVKDLYTGQKEVGLAGVKHGFRKDEIAAQGVVTRQNQAHQGSIVRANQTHQGSVTRSNQEHAASLKSAQPGKPMSPSAASGLLENHRNLRRAQTALALISGDSVGDTPGDKNATGVKGYLPNQVLNRMDPSGVDTRAAIADLGSLVIHDRSGAAVTAAEFPRLAPFIPTEKDDPQTARKKLTQFVKNYQAQIDDTTEFYREMGYNVPTQVLQPAAGSQAASGGKDLPRVATPADAKNLPSGTRFIDPNGITRTVP